MEEFRKSQEEVAKTNLDNHDSDMKFRQMVEQNRSQAILLAKLNEELNEVREKRHSMAKWLNGLRDSSDYRDVTMEQNNEVYFQELLKKEEEIEKLIKEEKSKLNLISFKKPYED